MRQLYNKYINNTQSVACVVYFITFNDKLKSQQILMNKIKSNGMFSPLKNLPNPYYKRKNH